MGKGHNRASSETTGLGCAGAQPGALPVLMSAVARCVLRTGAEPGGPPGLVLLASVVAAGLGQMHRHRPTRPGTEKRSPAVSASHGKLGGWAAQSGRPCAARGSWVPGHFRLRPARRVCGVARRELGRPVFVGRPRCRAGHCFSVVSGFWVLRTWGTEGCRRLTSNCGEMAAQCSCVTYSQCTLAHGMGTAGRASPLVGDCAARLGGRVQPGSACKRAEHALVPQ